MPPLKSASMWDDEGMAKRRAKPVIRGLKSQAAGEMNRRYVEGYRKKPEDAAWAETAAKVVSRVLPRGKW